MRDATASLFQFASGHTLDLAAVVKAHEPAPRAVTNPDRNEKFRRGMGRTAILLARPVAPGTLLNLHRRRLQLDLARSDLIK